MKIVFAIAMMALGAVASQETPTKVESSKLDANGASRAPSMSDDGDIIVFESKASNLVSDDTDGEWDVFAHSRNQHRTWQISGNDAIPARNPTVSGDGRWVAYLRLRFGERPSEGVRVWSLVLHDLRTGKSTPLDTKTQGWGDEHPPRAPSLSRDGRYLVYVSKDDKPKSIGLAYLLDRESGTTEIISLGTHGGMPDRDVVEPAISSNGRFVVFCTDSNTVATPMRLPFENSAFDFLHDRQHVFVRDRQEQTTRYASDVALKQLGYADYHDPRISDDGRFVAYDHHDSRLSYAPHAGFVSDLVEARPGRLIDTVAGEWFQGAVRISWLSADGRYVLVESARPLAAAPTTKDVVQLYVRDLNDKTWKLLSRGLQGAAANGASRDGVASSDLSVVTFASDASNLIEGDGNGWSDIFVLDTTTGRIERISVAATK